MLMLALGVLWATRFEHGPSFPALAIVGLVATAAVAERITIQLGPRSWYTPSTPVIVLAGLLGGPLAGIAAAVAGQVVPQESVWRKRASQGGLGGLQGFLAGVVGTIGWTSSGAATAAAVGAMLVAIAVNTAGRALIMLERKTEPFMATWTTGIVVDLVDATVAIPVLGVLLLTAAESATLVVTTIAALLVALTIAQRMRETIVAELAVEQANARRDQLTGAPNRRAFEEALNAEHARIVRGGQPAGLFVVDIDRFKSINDRYGHSVGDDVIVEVVRLLTDGLRPADVVARWGGEEITVLAPGVRTRRALEQSGERIRLLVAELPLAMTAATVPVTVSVGATLLDGSLAPAAAIRRADGALYDAKRTRDTAVIALPPRLALGLESA